MSAEKFDAEFLARLDAEELEQIERGDMNALIRRQQREHAQQTPEQRQHRNGRNEDDEQPLSQFPSTDRLTFSFEREPALTSDILNAEIARLAKLTVIEYEQQRKAAAERLNMRASVLDKLVQIERERLGGDDDGKQGHAISFPEPEPWPDELSGAELLDAIATAVRDYVVLSDHCRAACALWCVHTFLLDCFLI
jgi:hypothetical protein